MYMKARIKIRQSFHCVLFKLLYLCLKCETGFDMFPYVVCDIFTYLDEIESTNPKR